MEKITLKRSWYDGWFYTLFIDNKKSKLRHKIFGIIERDKSIIDIGCGTGGLALKLAGKSRKVVGIDISKRMINKAIKRKNLGNDRNIDFIHANAIRMSETVLEKFDYAIFSFFIHEINPEFRPLIIDEAKKISNKIIIFDYNIPLPPNLIGYFIQIIEFFAGRSHFKNFRDFVKSGGIKGYFDSDNWDIEFDHINRKKIFRTTMYQKKMIIT